MRVGILRIGSVNIAKKEDVRMMAETKVYIIESKRGWGQRIDEVKKFSSREEAEIFATTYNDKYNSETTGSDSYMYAKVEGR